KTKTSMVEECLLLVLMSLHFEKGSTRRVVPFSNGLTHECNLDFSCISILLHSFCVIR
ncbi:hypothetical protein L9F63_004788, partial [Diploptera punctata]